MILKHIIIKEVIDINTKPIVLDINKKFYDVLTAKQGDTKSRFLFFKLLDRSIHLDLTGKKVICYLVKPDSKKVFNYLVINDAKKGYCTLELTNQILAVNGIVNLELMITQEDKKLTTIPFKLDVVKSLNDGFVESTHEFNALMDCLGSVEKWDKEFADKTGKIEELYTTRLNGIDASLEDKVNIMVGDNIPNVSDRVKKTFYFKVTSEVSNGGNNELKVTPNMGIKIL